MNWLDIVIVLLLVWQIFYGWRVGLIVSLCAIAGIVAGGIAAYFLAPWVSNTVTDAAWRMPLSITTILLCLLAGYALGMGLGRVLNRVIVFKPLRIVNRLLGAVLLVAVTLMLIPSVASSLSLMGNPEISKAVRESSTLQFLETSIPKSVQEALARGRTSLIDEGIPQVIDQFGPVTPTVPPNTVADNPALNVSAKSVVKIAGSAAQCGVTQTGSGFVIAPERVMTNAHVVAGVDRPIVESSGKALNGNVVYFDPKGDVAVVAVNGLEAPTIRKGQDVEAGTVAAFQGYPLGGPFTSKPASVMNRARVMSPDIYGGSSSLQETYQIAGDVISGNSGGPLLTEDGALIGLVYAKSASQQPIGYAYSLKNIQAVINQAPGFSQKVPSGACIKDKK